MLSPSPTFTFAGLIAFPLNAKPFSSSSRISFFGPGPCMTASWSSGSNCSPMALISSRPRLVSVSRRCFSIAWMPLTHSFSANSLGRLSKARLRLSITGKRDVRRSALAKIRNSAWSCSTRRLKFWRSATARFVVSERASYSSRSRASSSLASLMSCCGSCCLDMKKRLFMKDFAYFFE